MRKRQGTRLRLSKITVINLTASKLVEVRGGCETGSITTEVLTTKSLNSCQ